MATNMVDLTGKRFGRLTVLERCENKTWKNGRSRPQWQCLCDCGNKKKVPSHYLNNGHTTSCGCARISDLIGKTFGRLTVIAIHSRKTQPNGQIRIEWLCQCDCGNMTIVSTGNLQSKHTTSCGCLVCSAQEAVIVAELRKRNIKYEKEYMFADLISNGAKPRPFRFDFAFFDGEGKLLAQQEYQGQQHYVTAPGFESFGAGQRHYSDALKKEYCQQNKIPLYEITYLDDTINKLSEILSVVYDNTVPSSEISEKV